MEAIQRDVARVFVEIDAVHCNIVEPFRLTSGTLSPSYIDCRKIISFPKQRKVVVDAFVDVIEKVFGLDSFDYLAGGETAGIPYASFVAERTGLPMVYVRKKPKGFGRLQQVEGSIEEGQRVLLIEDLMFDAGSKLAFKDGIEKSGAVMDQLAVIFEYGNPESKRKLDEAGVTYHALTNWQVLIDVIEEEKHLSPEEIEQIRLFLKDPKGWETARC
jgi:orotate phosphoribosyltransferase